MDGKARRAARHRRDEGAVMVEFALIAGLLVMLLVGIVQFGLAYSAQVSIQGAAREGARALALGQPGSVAAAVNAAKGSATNVSVVTVASCGTIDPNNPTYATVRVNATYTFSIPFINLGTRPMSATASMRCGL